MRVLLIASNRERSPFPVAPIGPLAVASAARSAGFDVEFLDLGTCRWPRRALRAALKRGPYGAVALGIRNLDNCSLGMPWSYLAETAAYVHEIGRASDAPLILGGSGFSVAPAGWMRRLAADHGVVGEGEGAFPELLRRLASGQSTAGIPGVIAAADPEGPGSEATGIPGIALDTLPLPAHEDCRYSWYLERGGFVGVQGKRGCPHRCVYCAYPNLEGSSFRQRDPEAVADEIEDVSRRHEARWFFFVDGVFNSPRRHALEVCRALIRHRIDIGWMAYCNPVGFDRELASAMMTSGCVGVEFGLDATIEKMLHNLRKPFTQKDIRRALEAAARVEMPAAVHLLFGGPEETIADVRETQRFLDSCATVNAVFASVGIRIHENTGMEAIAREEGLLTPESDLFEPVFYVSPGLTDDPLAAVDAVVRQRPEWSSPADWKKLSMRAIQRVVNRFGSRPQWTNVRQYGLHVRR